MKKHENPSIQIADALRELDTANILIRESISCDNQLACAKLSQVNNLLSNSMNRIRRAKRALSDNKA